MALRPTSMRVLGLLSAVALISALMGVSVPALAKGPPSDCKVQNIDSGEVHSSLQAAVSAATAEDWLTVQGRCPGPVAIDRDLAIRGVRAGKSGTPTIVGGGNGPVLAIAEGVVVAVKELDLVGSGNAAGIVVGAGAMLTLRSVAVNGFQTTGNGAAITNSGTLKLRGSTVISDNSADRNGGGVYSLGTVEMHDTAAVSGNSARWGGGVVNFGTLVMNGGSSISGNTAAVYGAGVYNKNTGAALWLNDSSTISGNSGAQYGGGVFNDGTVALSGSGSIIGNVATVAGGGIYCELGSIHGVIVGVNVSENSPDDLSAGCNP